MPPGVLLVLAAVGSVLVFAAIFRYAPRRRLRWRACLLGALPAGVGLQVVPTVVSVYVDAVAGLQAVRLFLVLAVVLLGLTIVAMLVLVGAGIAASAERAVRAAARGAVRSPWRRGRRLRSRRAQRCAPLQVLHRSRRDPVGGPCGPAHDRIPGI